MTSSAGRRSAILSNPRAGSWTWLAIGLAAVAIGIVSEVTSWLAPGFSATRSSPLGTGLVLVAGWSLVAAGVDQVRRGRRRPFGALLAVAGIDWLLWDWADPVIGSPVPFTIGVAVGLLTPAIIVHALLAFDRGRLSAVDRLVVGLGYLVFGGLLGLFPTLTFDAAATGCGQCPEVWAAVAPSAAISGWSITLGIVGGAAWASAMVVVLGGRLVRASPAGRWVKAPVLGPGAAYVMVVGLDLWRSIGGSTIATDATAQTLRLAQAAALVAMALGVAFEAVRARWSRNRVARVVTDLRHSPSPGGFRDALAATLDDPDLRIAYPIGTGRHVDAEGHDIAVDGAALAGRRTTPIVRDGEVVAVLDHRADVLDAPATMDEVVRAARLGLEHERLRAAIRAQLVDLTAARKRIVAAADEERRRLERDLHDGAQQRLIALSVRLRVLAGDPAGLDSITVEALDTARREIGLAIDELREVAHGIYPSILADQGLVAAIEGLAEGSTVVVTFDGFDVGRIDLGVEAAAYAVVADVAAAGTGPVRVTGGRSGDILDLTVTAPDVPGDVVEELTDRVAAVDGQLDARRDASQGLMVLHAAMPCGS